MKAGRGLVERLFLPGLRAWLAALVAMGIAMPAMAFEPVTIRIGTGGITGIYHAWGAAICRLLADDAQFYCELVPGSGSIENVEALREGSIDFALVQANFQARAFRSRMPFAQAGPLAELRHVLTLTPELMTAIAKPGVWRNPSLPIPKASYFGSAGSGSRAMLELAQGYGIRLPAGSFAGGSRRNLPSAVAVDAFCAGELDLLFYMVSHPNDVVTQALRQCRAEICPLAGPVSANIIQGEPFFDGGRIARTLYPELQDDIATFGTRTTLITLADVPDVIVEAVAAALLERTAEIQRLHLAFAGMTRLDFLAACNEAPQHGAVHAYRRRMQLPDVGCHLEIGRKG